MGGRGKIEMGGMIERGRIERERGREIYRDRQLKKGREWTATKNRRQDQS